MYDHTMHPGKKKTFLQAFSTEKILNSHVKNCFKVNMLYSKIMKKEKSPFMIYADFESILEPEDNGNQNPGESYTNKYKKHAACNYGYKLIFVDDKSSKPKVILR